MDPQVVDFPNRQPYEGFVARRDDPKNLGRVRVEIPGHWEPYGPWCKVFGARYGGGRIDSNGERGPAGWTGVPPEGAAVLVFFVNGNAENPRVIAGHLGEDEFPAEHEITSDGDNKVYQDERILVEVDSRESTYGIRIKDVDTEGDILDVDLDMATGQVGLQTIFSILVKAGASLRLEAPMVTINERVVLTKGPPI